MWNLCFLRSFAHRLSAVAKEEIQETVSVDSFIDVVDLKPNRPEIHSDSSGSEDDEILPATFMQGPKAASRRGGSIKRVVSQKIEPHQIAPLISSCCNDIQKNFKEFLRFDFSNIEIPKNPDSETVMTPEP